MKSTQRSNHICDLLESFEVLMNCNKKLNPLKSVFGVDTGNFLGFMITNRRIETNSDKIRAILDMKDPKTIHDIQKLNITALSCFLAGGQRGPCRSLGC